MPDSPTVITSRRRWSAPGERIFIQVIHWFVVLVVAILIYLLASRRALDHPSVTALYGVILGHAGTAASQKLSSRSDDHPQSPR